ncbi:MAG: ABC transporter permease [Planctomycetota bacterium]
MMLFEFVREALKNLRRHKLRSFLTTLGIVFGIASVMSMVSTGEGARRAILSQIQQLGINNIIINAKKPPLEQNIKKEEASWVLRYGLTFRDAEQVKKTLPMVESVLPVHDVKKWLWFKSRRLEAKVRGVTPEYFERLRLEPVIGRRLTQLDGILRRRVCVVRSRLLREARYVGDPLKLDLKLGADYYRVVGVLPDFEFQSPNMAVLGIDERTLEVYVPFTTVISRLGLTQYTSQSGSQEATRVELDQLVCSVASEDHVMLAARCIQSILDKFHEKKDYEVTVPLELLESRQRTQRVFNIVLPIIAGISLLVGGIGILNIMLASITERTREIGIRRALGASRTDITYQFLIETVTLATLGGILGVGFGGVGVLVLETLTDWQAVVTGPAVLLSLGISCLTGIAFGIYPARRAAQMNPIQALRHE